MMNAFKFASPRGRGKLNPLTNGDKATFEGLVNIFKEKKSNRLKAYWTRLKFSGYYPEVRSHATLTKVGNEHYMFGGQCIGMSSNIRVLSEKTWRWKILTPVENGQNPPEGRVGHTAVAWEDQIVIFGGSGVWKNEKYEGRACFPLIHCLSVATQEWNTHKPEGTQF